jgi:AcrR family transcriptional regulator
MWAPSSGHSSIKKELDLEKRGHKKLNRAMIAGAALEIIDREGLPGLSMRHLGNSLGVEGMALYRHFPEKEAILDQVVEMVLEGLVLPATGQGWHESLRAVASSLRERLLLHPNAMPLVAARWLHTPVLRNLAKAAVDDVTLAGFDQGSAYSVVHAIMSFVLGHSWLGVGGYVGEIPETGGLTRKPVAPVVPGLADGRQEAERLEFERGLDFLLKGVGHLLLSAGTRP